MSTDEIEPAIGNTRPAPLSASLASEWLSAGWRDLTAQPGPSLAYGAGVFVVSLLMVAAMFGAGWEHILFPALSGFMIVGPLIAIGLYEKSRRLQAGDSVALSDMVMVRPPSGGQILFIGVILTLLIVFWLRAAVLIYALFFGLHPFPGMDEILPMLVATPTGWAMLLVGTVVGGLFAAFAFSISVFAIPMLLDENVDALTAMGMSMALVWRNLALMITWGTVVLALFAFAVLTGFIGMIVVFPLLGHATWHAYRTVRTSRAGNQ